VALQIDLGEAYRSLARCRAMSARQPGQHFAAMENYGKAEAILRPLAAREPRNPAIQRNLALTYKLMGDLQSTRRAFPQPGNVPPQRRAWEASWQ